MALRDVPTCMYTFRVGDSCLELSVCVYENVSECAVVVVVGPSHEYIKGG